MDARIGGFVLPFARELGYPIPAFDFTLPGVVSISVDVHKFGYANKGVSVLLLLRDKDLVAYQRTTFDAWPSGRYSTPNITGSRSGGAIASAWAVMRYLGRDGYRERVRAIRERLIAGIRAMPELEVIGEPHAHQFNFTSRAVDISAVAGGLADRSWVVGLAHRNCTCRPAWARPTRASRRATSSARPSVSARWMRGTTRPSSVATTRPMLISACRTMAPSRHDAFTPGCRAMAAAHVPSRGRGAGASARPPAPGDAPPRPGRSQVSAHGVTPGQAGRPSALRPRRAAPGPRGRW